MNPAPVHAEVEKKRILVILGHPDTNSLNGALADEYARGATLAGASVRRLALGSLAFDPILRYGYKQLPDTEPDLKWAQESISWAEHLTFVYPVWWAGVPSLLKGFIDRVFLPGFAFRYRKGLAYERLLAGRSARLIVTTDAPVWYHKWFLGAPDIRSLRKGTLEFSGIKPVSTTVFGPVRSSTSAIRQGWLDRVNRLGASMT